MNNRSKNIKEAIAYSFVFIILAIILTSCSKQISEQEVGVLKETSKLIGQGELEEALKRVDNLLEENPNLTEALSQKGYILLLQGQIEDSIKLLEQAKKRIKSLNSEIDKETLLLNLAKAYYKNNDFEKAIKTYDKIITMNPNSADAYGNRAMARYEISGLDLALVDIDTAMNIAPDLIYLYDFRGLILSKAGKNEEALINYSKAISRWPENGLLYLRRGDLYFLQEEYSKAILDYKLAVGGYPLESLSSIGYTFMKMKDYDQAIIAFDDYLDFLKDIDPKQVDYKAIYEKALAYHYLGKYDDSDKHINILLENDPKDEAAIFLKGVNYSNRGKWHEALGLFEEILKMNPDNLQAKEEIEFIKENFLN